MTAHQLEEFFLLLGRLEGKLDMTLGRQVSLENTASNHDTRLRKLETEHATTRGWLIGAFLSGGAGGAAASQLLPILF